MKKSVITELMLYRYRYAIGYGLFIIALLSLLVIAGLFIPGGLSQAEMTSATTSASFPLIALNDWPIINLPYHLLQKASIAAFGLSDISIKLPSLIIALVTGVSFLVLLRHWFKHNVAILASIIAVTASQFLIIAQSGTPTILLLFWSTILLLTATYTSLHAKQSFLWKLLFFGAAALSLYTPLSIYIIIAMAIAAIIHPHLRFMLLRLSFTKVIISVILTSVLLVPLFWHVMYDPAIILTLFGLPSDFPTWAHLVGNIKYLLHAFLGFPFPVMVGAVLLPLYGISAIALMLLGTLQLAVDHHSARTYTIGIWMVLLGALLILQPEHIPILFIPLLLMLAIGLNVLFGKWYDIFPRNPYARAAALLPLVILLGGVVIVGVDRYTGAYRYSPAVADYFSHDLSLVRHELKQPDAPMLLIVPKESHAFYSILAKKNPSLVVSYDIPPKKTPALIASSKITLLIQKRYGMPTKLVTNGYSKDSLRFYLYK